MVFVYGGGQGCQTQVSSLNYNEFTILGSRNNLDLYQTL